MHLYIDESGNTGLDLFNRDQPVFSLAATNLSSEQCSELIAPLLRQGQTEAKYSKLKGSNRGQQALIRFFSSPLLDESTAKVMLADKRYYLISHFVDKLIEPTIHEAGIDLYAGDGQVGLTNVWYYSGDRIFQNGLWNKLLRSFLQAIRKRTDAAYTDFDDILTKAYRAAPDDLSDFAAGIFVSRGRLKEFIGVYTDIEVFDPAADLFISMINNWMASNSCWLKVTHDRSKPLRRNERFIRTLMTPRAKRIIGYGDRQAELPLRISDFDFGDSHLYSQLQVADLIAGASVDCLLAWSGRRSSTNYHKEMRLYTDFPTSKLR